MPDRAIVLSYDMSSDESGRLTLVARTTYVRDGYSGVYTLEIPVIINASDGINQIGTKVVSAIRAAGVAEQYDLTASGSILLPDYTKV